MSGITELNGQLYRALLKLSTCDLELRGGVL